MREWKEMKEGEVYGGLGVEGCALAVKASASAAPLPLKQESHTDTQAGH